MWYLFRKKRRKILYGKVREYFKSKLHELAGQRECKIISGYLVQDHVHMLIAIPPKRSVGEVVGYLKGKSAIAIARQFSGRRKNFTGEKLWARGYAVSTVGFEESAIDSYIQNQEQLDSHGKDEDGKFWRLLTRQSLGLLTSAKPPALRERYLSSKTIGKFTYPSVTASSSTVSLDVRWRFKLSPSRRERMLVQRFG